MSRVYRKTGNQKFYAFQLHWLKIDWDLIGQGSKLFHHFFTKNKELYFFMLRNVLNFKKNKYTFQHLNFWNPLVNVQRRLKCKFWKHNSDSNLEVLVLQLGIKQKKGSFCAFALMLSLLVLLLATASIKASSAAMALFISAPYLALSCQLDMVFCYQNCSDLLRKKISFCSED